MIEKTNCSVSDPSVKREELRKNSFPLLWWIRCEIKYLKMREKSVQMTVEIIKILKIHFLRKPQ